MHKSIPDRPKLASRVVGAVEFLHGTHWGRALIGVSLGGIVLVLKIGLIEPNEMYEETRLGTYEIIQRVLSNRQAAKEPVTVVDISKIDKVHGDDVSPVDATSDDSSKQDEEPATSRKQLLAGITSIAEAHPLAIGVDIDFSADDHGNPITMGDADFFRECLNLEKKYQTHIFLGVDRHAASAREDWLGSADFQSLAAGLGVGNKNIQGPANELKTDRVLRMFSWTRSAPVVSQLPSLAFALARASGAPSQEPPGFLTWAIEFAAEYSPVPDLETKGFLVDYRLLDRLVENKIDFSSVSRVPADRFRDRVVVLGVVRKTRDDGHELKRDEDFFRVPGREGLFSGALLHACAVDTLIDAPVRKWTGRGRVVADMLLASCAVGLIELLGWLFYGRHGKKHHDFRIHWSVTLVIAIAIGAVAIPFVGTFRLAWDDAVFVALGLVAHTGLDHLLSKLLHRHKPHEHEKHAKPEPSSEQEQIDEVAE